MNRNDSKLTLDEMEAEVFADLAPVRELEMSASPFLKGRLLALAEERVKASSKRRRWSWVTGLSLAVCSLVLAFAFGVFRLGYTGIVNQQMVLRLDGREAGSSQVAAVQVELPEGVQFSIEQLPELSSHSVLTLPLSAATLGSPLPVVIRGLQPGLKRVRVRYLDAASREVSSRVIPIRFSKDDQRI